MECGTACFVHTLATSSTKLEDSRMRVFLLYIVPLILIGLFLLAVANPELAKKIGGTAAFIGFLTVLLTYFYVVLTGLMVRQMVKAQEEERRPYITVDIEFEQSEGWLVISNIGRLPATDVKINIDPEIVAVRERKLSETILGKPIAYFPPGKTLRSFVDVGRDLLGKDSPKEFTARVSYSLPGKAKRHTDTYSINLDFYSHRMYTPQRDLNDINERLKEIERHLATLAKSEGRRN